MSVQSVFVAFCLMLNVSHTYQDLLVMNEDDPYC